MGLFKKLLKIIAIILVIIAIVYLLIAALAYIGAITVAKGSFLAAMALGSTAWYSFALIAVAALLVASIMSPEGFEEAISRVESGVSTVVDATVGVVTDAIGSVVTAAVSSPLVWIAGAYLLLGNRGGSSGSGSSQFSGESGEPGQLTSSRQDQYIGGSYVSDARQYLADPYRDDRSRLFYA